MDFILTEDNKIKEEIIKKVKEGQLINYEKFLELYEPYKEKISEVDFANILGISYANYQSIRNSGTRAKIFKMNYSKLSEEEKEKIKKEIIKKVKEGTSINYEKFLELYEPYKEKISEVDFANILGISYNNHQSIRNGGTRTKIFKINYSKLSEKEKEKIKKEIIKKVKEGQLINYEKYLELYEPYKEKISEVDFASILGISYSSYQSIKNRGARAKIFKKSGSKLIERKIKKEILKKEKEGQSIGYEKFLELYEPYKEKISEVDFASILEISYSSYISIKIKGKRAKIFKKKYLGLSEEEKERIKKEILKKVKKGQLINYEKFLELYEPYKEKISEIDFASILGISYSSYRCFKRKGKRTKIFKINYLKINKEEKEKIKKEILKKEKEGTSINYEKFLELYKPYKEKISEVDFASILGISYSSYQNIKNKGLKTILRDYKTKAKIDRIKYLLKESRYYSKQELEKLSKKYKINLTEILQDFFNLKNNDSLIALENCLEIKGKLWIGKVNCSKEFSLKYAQYMIDVATTIGNKYCNIYKLEIIKDDIISNSIIYIIEKCGYIEKNYITEEQVKIVIANLIKRYIKNEFSWQKRKITDSLFELNENGEEINPFDKGIKDNSTNVEKDVIENITQDVTIDINSELFEDACLRLLNKYIEIGYEERQAMVEVSKFVGIEINELIEMLRKYMIEQKQVKETSEGNYILKK